MAIELETGRLHRLGNAVAIVTDTTPTHIHLRLNDPTTPTTPPLHLTEGDTFTCDNTTWIVSTITTHTHTPTGMVVATVEPLTDTPPHPQPPQPLAE